MVQLSMTDLDTLHAWLSSQFDHDTLMPCEGKRPRYAFADGQWSWAAYAEKTATDVRAKAAVGILLHRLCVVDVDDLERVRELETRFPVLTSVPRAKTHRGMHYYFTRSATADRHGFYNSASARIPNVDLKTVCRNGTPSFLVAPPTHGKTWVVAPWVVEPVPIPDDLLRAVAVPVHHALQVDLVFHDGTLEVRDDPIVSQMAFLEPWAEGDLEDGEGEGEGDTIVVPMPKPFSKETFELLLSVVARTAAHQRLSVTDLDRYDDIKRLADFVGLPERYRKAFVPSVPHNPWIVMTDLVELDPMWAEHSFPSRQDDRLRPVGKTRLGYDPVRTFDNKYMWLLPNATRPVIPTGTPVLYASEDLAWRVWDAAPAHVRSALKRFPRRLIVAGGWVLGETSPHVAAGDDIDLFMVEEDASKARGMIADVISLVPDVTSAHRTGAAITVTSGEDTPSVLQVILRRYRSVHAVLQGFDVDPCRVALWWDGSGPRLEAPPAWFDAMRHLALWVDPTRWNFATTGRVWKYYAKGLDIFVPGIRRVAFQPDLYKEWSMTLSKSKKPGFVNLFHIERWWTHYKRTPPSDSIMAAVRRLNYWGAVAESGYDQRILLRGPWAMWFALRSFTERACMWITGGAPQSPPKDVTVDFRDPATVLEADLDIPLVEPWQDSVFHRRSPCMHHLYDTTFYRA